MYVCVCSLAVLSTLVMSELHLLRISLLTAVSLHLWIHILCYMSVLPIFSPLHVSYLHHFFILYCILIVHVCIWVCVLTQMCMLVQRDVSARGTTCRSQLSSVMRVGKLGCKSLFLLLLSCRPGFILHWCLLTSTYLAKHFSQSDC